MLVGANVFSLMENAEDQDLISAELFDLFGQWAKDFMAGEPVDFIDPWNIDWQTFHMRGMELARRLKRELGSTADVQYVRPSEDRCGLGDLMLSLTDE